MKNYLFILLSISLSICVNAQSNSFKYPSLDIELHPKVPAVCPDGLKITTVEDYLTYTWIHDETETVISNEKEAFITTAGDYTLEITSYVASKPCFFEKKFNVIDLNNTDGISKYLEESGFYKVPIWREDIPSLKPNEKNRSAECHEDLIRFSEEVGSEFVNIKSVSEDVLANFKPIKAEYGDHKNIFTENSCLCNNGIPDLESEFNSGETALWNHSFYENENDLQGFLYVKAKMPFEESLPLPEQMDFLKEIHPDILTENESTLKQGQTVISDLFMARPIGGFVQQEQCNATFDIENSYFLSPAGMPIKPSSDVSNLVFQTEDDENGIFEGALLSMDLNNKSYKAIEYNSGLFAGYYNYIVRDFIEDFEIPTNSIEYSSINLPFICEGECLSKKELINFDVTEQLVSDGGFTYYTKSGIENKNIFLSEKSIKDWILNKIYETKTYINNNLTLPFVTSDYNNKYLFITDVLLGGQKYEAIGMKINFTPPFTGSTLVNLSNPQIVEFSNQEEFNYSIELDENILIAAFKTNVTCNGFINNFYDINNESNGISIDFSNLISVSNTSTDKLFEYITNGINHENLLIFANGYRINTADLFGSKNIVKNWKTFFNTDYTNQENIRFHDYYAESGEYWEDIDDIFIDHIGTQNVIYADGHDNILTSNHKNTLTFDPQGEKDIKKSKLSLAIGFASTLATRGKRVQHALYKTAIGTISSQAYNAIPGYDSSMKNNPDWLVLDYNSNIDGFNDRYLNGFAYGVKVYNNIQNNNIKVAKDEMGKVTGKIDIVAHSMGYAYAAGILDALIDLKVLAEGNKFGGFYIIAPENAPVKNINDILDKTDYVWQYGTAEVGSPNPNLLHHQDGIAPQVPVPDLTFSSGNLTKGRIKYAGELSKAGFGLHHLSSSYDWIINDIDEGIRGYVQKRN